MTTVLFASAIGAVCIAFLCGFLAAWKLRDMHESEQRGLVQRTLQRRPTGA